MTPITHFTEYRHGQWRRIGDEIEVFAIRRIMPGKLVPDYNKISPGGKYVCRIIHPLFKWYWRVPVAGWSSRIASAS